MGRYERLGRIEAKLKCVACGMGGFCPLRIEWLEQLALSNHLVPFTMKDVLKRLKNRKPPGPPKGQVLPA